ncbi:MAG: DUF4412 domain-containing protein [Gemmatimonadota bacterium]|nr:DUF4412 domain-containing protein [Gemmatimonadota bacterium]
MPSPTISRIGLAVALFLPTALPAQEAFQGAITYRMQGEQMTLTMTMISKGPWMRTNMAMPGMPGEIFVIMNTDSSLARTVMPEMGMYMEMDLKAILAEAQKLLPQSTRDSLAARAGGATIEPTGTSDEIAGVACRNYRFTTGTDQAEACIATGLGTLGGAGSADAFSAANPMAGMMPDMAAFAREFPNGMLALRMRTLKNGTWETMMEATKIDRTVPDDALFKLPPGLTKMDPPSS